MIDQDGLETTRSVVESWAFDQLNGHYTKPRNLEDAITDKKRRHIIWILSDILFEHAGTLLAGISEIGKTRLLVYIDLCIAYGIPVFGIYTVKRRPVLYIAYEDGVDKILDMLDTLPYAKHIRANGHGTFHVVDYNHVKRLRLGGFDYIQHWLKDHPGGVIIIDMLPDAATKDDRGSYDKERDFIREIVRFCETNNATMIGTLHTTKKPGETFAETARGHTGYGSGATIRWMFKRYHNQNVFSISGKSPIKPLKLILDYTDTVGWFTMLSHAEMMKRRRKQLLKVLISEPNNLRLGDIRQACHDACEQYKGDHRVLIHYPDDDKLRDDLNALIADGKVTHTPKGPYIVIR
jgi:hypothetical protein